MREMLEESIEKLLGQAIDPELLLKAEGGAWSGDLWAMIEEAGFTLALVPEEQGGAGARWADVFTLFRAAGRYSAPVPFGETVIANWLLALAGLDLVEGPISLARLQGDNLVGVPWGRNVAHVVAVADREVRLYATEGLAVSEGLNIAREPRDDLALGGAKPVAAGPLPAHLPADALERGGALVRAAQISGGLQQALDMTLRYAEERSQFGRQIGKFQAVQQQLAVLAEHTSIALIAADAGFAFAANGLPLTESASAKVVCGEAAAAGAAIAHAVHGAIGVTYEHALHLTTRRLQSWRSEFGSERYWSERLGRAIAAQPADQFWPSLTIPLTEAV